MNKRDANILLPALVVIIAITIYLLASNFFLPSIGENQAKIEAANSDIASATAKIDSLSSAEQKMTGMSDLVNNLLLAIPANVDAPNLITEIEAIAGKNQVSMPSLTPPSEPAAGSNSVSTSITIVGSFQNIYNFIGSLESSIRYSKIDSLTISSGDGSLTATINFEVYSRPAAGGSGE